MGYIRVITYLLTIDPNFLGHPSTTQQKSEEMNLHRKSGLADPLRNCSRRNVTFHMIQRWVVTGTLNNHFFMNGNGEFQPFFYVMIWFIIQLKQPLKMVVLGFQVIVKHGLRTVKFGLESTLHLFAPMTWVQKPRWTGEVCPRPHPQTQGEDAFMLLGKQLVRAVVFNLALRLGDFVGHRIWFESSSRQLIAKW